MRKVSLRVVFSLVSIAICLGFLACSLKNSNTAGKDFNERGDVYYINNKSHLNFIQKAPFKHIRVVNPTVNYDASSGGWQYRTLLLLEEATERVVSTVSIKSLDPFGVIMNSTVPSEKLRPPEFYQISESSRIALRAYLQNAGWESKIPVDKVQLIRWEPLLYDINSITDYIAVGFQLYLMDEHNVIFAEIAEYKVLDRKGNITAELRSDLGGAPPIVTQDGKWMAVRYGEEYADYSLSTGLIFFNLETKQAVYQDTITPNKGGWIGYFPIHDYIVSVNDYGSSFNNMYSIYKLNEGRKYTRLFDETTGAPGAVIFENYDESGVFYPALRHSSRNNAEKKRADFERDFDSANLKKCN